MKLLKALAGKTIFVIIAIILQIAIYLLLANLVERLILAIPWEVDIPGEATSTRVSQFIVAVLELVVAFIVIVRLTVRDMLPDAKVAWVTLLVFAPVAGSIIYLMFS